MICANNSSVWTIGHTDSEGVIRALVLTQINRFVQQRCPESMEPHQVTPLPPKANELPEALRLMTDNSLAKHITARLMDLYKDQPKDLQVEAVSSLV
ncbi:uncharacterized protein PGTG_21989 [Puccinia graminis f. sp. tritici CRL 75-36-700-3]|uniref:Uncharacterized protein n=1 Tax=Puccinia graminis f. sp. tritici (strain CRL 75-36-700-3 / race SCCL) TaxID=418459 RepID=H6QT32_PUCGT|nr:uncharacterized protein PGTG_21989 [Puccinia graminis f. sp. tritici CRL 75-36-700-3]EHS63986.1 hypothetical protein PGTG_21989 [Puccinia graminis f. sp. tritici CRL 75-36-700-3]